MAVGARRVVFVYTDPGARTTRQAHPLEGTASPSVGPAPGIGDCPVHVAVAVRSWPALERYEAALARWRGAPVAKPLDAAERQLLEAILAAVKAGDREALDGWGGFMEASRIVGALRRREAGSSSGASGQIDSFETHLAERISADTYGA